MDKSIEYTSMCVNSVPIQDIFKKNIIKNPKIFDGSYVWTGKSLVVINTLKKRINVKISAWIPRQDEIQELLLEGKNMTWEFAADFDNFCFDLRVSMGGVFPYPTFEKIWCAFLMYNMHGKIWDGKVWCSLGKTTTIAKSEFLEDYPKTSEDNGMFGQLNLRSKFHK